MVDVQKGCSDGLLQFVTEGREGVKFGQKKRDIFLEWPQEGISIHMIIGL